MHKLNNFRYCAGLRIDARACRRFIKIPECRLWRGELVLSGKFLRPAVFFYRAAELFLLFARRQRPRFLCFNNAARLVVLRARARARALSGLMEFLLAAPRRARSGFLCEGYGVGEFLVICGVDVWYLSWVGEFWRPLCMCKWPLRLD